LTLVLTGSSSVDLSFTGRNRMEQKITKLPTVMPRTKQTMRPKGRKRPKGQVGTSMVKVRRG
jgi:hypothetical protein